MFFTILKFAFFTWKNKNVSILSAHAHYYHVYQEESVKINSRHARKCYVNFMASMFKIIGRFLERQLAKSDDFDIPLLRRWNTIRACFRGWSKFAWLLLFTELWTIWTRFFARRWTQTIQAAMSLWNLHCVISLRKLLHALVCALFFVSSKKFIFLNLRHGCFHKGDTVFRSVILNSMFILRKSGKEVQDAVSSFKMAGIEELLAGPESEFFQNVKKILRQHMTTDTETTTSTFDIKSIVATCHSQDFPLHDNGKKGVFFRKQWGCTIFRGDSKTPLTLLPKEIGLAKKNSAISVCLTVSRDTLDACGVHVDDLEINNGDEIKLTITLMSSRSMEQFLREVSSMSTETVRGPNLWFHPRSQDNANTFKLEGCKFTCTRCWFAPWTSNRDLL